MRKVGIADLTIQSSFSQLFEKETWKGKWKEKNWNARSYHPKFIIEGFWMENCDRKRTWEKQESNFERNMAWEKLESTILPSKVHNYRFLKGKVWKEKEMRKVGIYVYDLTIQSLFLQLFEKENLKEKNKLEGFEKERKKNTFWASWSRFWNILSRGSEYIG